MKKTTVINLFGGPGSGKSTLAAGLYAQLKRMGHSTELVNEYVKKWAWTKRVPKCLDQIYFFGKQVHAESDLYGQVEFIITDSPVLLAPFYETNLFGTEIVLPSALRFQRYIKANDVDSINFFLPNTVDYSPEGRFQDAKTASKISSELYRFLKDNHVEFTRLTGEKNTWESQILSYLALKRGGGVIAE